MTMYSFEGKRPTVHPDAWIAPTATLIGDVTIEAGASIGYGAVLRADVGAIIVREGANIRDNSVLQGNERGCEVGRNAVWPDPMAVDEYVGVFRVGPIR